MRQFDEPYNEVVGKSYWALLEKGDNSVGEAIWILPGRLTMEAIYLFRRLVEKYREKKRYLRLIYIDRKNLW